MAGVLGLDFDSANPNNGDGPRLLGWANDACVDILLRTHCFIESTQMTMTPGVGDYELDPSIMALEDLFLVSGGANFRVRRLSTTDLINLRLFQVNSAPIQMYALNGANMLMVYPTPLNADVLNVYYVPYPTQMTDPTDDPSNTAGIPVEYHYGLELYMMWRGADFVDDESSSSGETYRRYYLGDPNAPPGSEQRDGFVGTMKKNIRKKGGKHLAGVLIPPRNRRIYIPQPGVDVGSQYAAG